SPFSSMMILMMVTTPPLHPPQPRQTTSKPTWPLKSTGLKRRTKSLPRTSRLFSTRNRTVVPRHPRTHLSNSPKRLDS
ncbi:hypothetical protein HDU76_007367, partial [Blyttiomyces sp. JEL0837]